MEEDIKILENKLKQWEPYKNVKFSTEIEKEIARENKAIENLINRNKELEQDYKELKEYMKRLDKLNSRDFIFKSKVEEKIEELENIKLCSDKFYELITENKIKLLQELLEE